MAQANGLLKPYGISPEDPPIAGAYCDVWHKPTIRPRALSQKDTKVFLQTGEYCGEKFEVGCADNGHEILRVTVNGTQAGIVQGKQGIAVQETPEMYGARLLRDITERPEFYFAQRTLSKTDQDLQEFAAKLPRIAQQIRYVERNDLWLPNLAACTATFRCDYCDLCRSGVKYQPGDPAPVGYKLGWGSTPPVPVTDGQEVEIG